jgi:hypothetical protein
MISIYLTKDDLQKIQAFVNKYHDVDVLELQADSSSGIGTILHVAVKTAREGDFVQIRKTIVDESSW